MLDRLERSVGLGRFRAPPQIARFGGLAAFPLAFSVLFGAVGATMLVFALLTSIRRRRAELALLKTLGFEGRQVVATVAWQATTIAVVGLVVGLPLGTALARFGWNVFADRLAILPRPVIPIVGAHARDPDHARPRKCRRRLACTHRLANEAGSRTASGVMASHVR